MSVAGAAGQRRPKVIMLGLRGVPNIQGGVETHVAALSERFVARGWDVEVLGRRPYLPDGGSQIWNGVCVTPIWSPTPTGLEALVHTALGVLVAARRSPDILHIHAIGPAIMTPLARLLGLRVIVTHHGFDYDRQKWGAFAKAVLRLGERVGMIFANRRIAISDEIARVVGERCKVTLDVVPNGVNSVTRPTSAKHLEALGLKPGRYIVLVARIVPEKRQLDLIQAFARLCDPDMKLALVGSTDGADSYLSEVKEATAKTPGVTMTGFQTGEALAQLYAHAALFVLPSSHEGMPIALLEALSYGVPALASGIPANLSIGLSADDYFPLGDIERLTAGLRAKLARSPGGEQIVPSVASVGNRMGWDAVADETLGLYEKVRRRKRA